MKTELTREQSAHLIELGVRADKASKSIGYDTPCEGVKGLYKRGDKVFVFTLADVVKLLPKEIYSEEQEISYYLTMSVSTFNSSVSYRHQCYTKGFGPTKIATELIDALYELLIWTIKNKHYQQ